ncbi:hypothetical protein B0H17DRAFT_1209101 [Mycena rosella]|uniref:Fungal N-terminal domain-containing protein n=1 Tax=Mycena rosella TaxID=1033263 RepID=A0AAD7CZU4_MYCRO|nr:hypothetical protein B0H17DRAFT_1209101 [Mycena rosella]
MSFALAYGSFGDLLETAKLAVKVAKFLREGGKMSLERQALATELQTLNNDLILLTFIASGMRLDPSSTSSGVAIRIRAEVQKCRITLIQFLDKITPCKGLLGTIRAALLEGSELARFKTEISKPLKAISMLMSILNLAASQEVGPQLNGVGLQVERLEDRFETLSLFVLHHIY